MIYFSGKDEAKRYSLYRPYIHPQVIQIIKSKLTLRKPIGDILDVGCGTGQSTIALTEIAERVTGIDISEDMISQAERHEKVKYLQAPAENIPLHNMSFDMVTVGLSFHWLDRRRFLPEAHRLLKSPGWLVIYDNFFSGVMRENPEFENWLKDEFIVRFPTPPRDRRPLKDDKLRQYGFVVDQSENYQEDVTYTLEQLVGYMTTMTNTVAILKEGRVTMAETVQWLMSSLEPFFRGQRACTFSHRGWIKFLKKLNQRAAEIGKH